MALPQRLGPTLRLEISRPYAALTYKSNFGRVVRFCPQAPRGLCGDSTSLRRNSICNATESTAAALKTCCKASAATAAAAAPAAASLPEAVVITVVVSTAYTALCFIMMALFPRKSASVFASVWPLVPLTLAYLALLVLSWSPDTLSIMMPGSLKEGLSGGFNPQFFPRLEGISVLFGRMGVTASWVLHVLVINLFVGRWCLLEGLRQRIPTAHSVLMCSVFGPLGLLCHYATLALSNVVTGIREPETPVTLQSDKGSITILPYTELRSSSSSP